MLRLLHFRFLVWDLRSLCIDDLVIIVIFLKMSSITSVTSWLCSFGGPVDDVDDVISSLKTNISKGGNELSLYIGVQLKYRGALRVMVMIKLRKGASANEMIHLCGLSGFSAVFTPVNSVFATMKYLHKFGGVRANFDVVKALLKMATNGKLSSDSIRVPKKRRIELSSDVLESVLFDSRIMMDRLKDAHLPDVSVSEFPDWES